MISFIEYLNEGHFNYKGKTYTWGRNRYTGDYRYFRRPEGGEMADRTVISRKEFLEISKKRKEEN